MTVFRLPYALLLGVLAFTLEFIPVIGVFISGALCVLVALTQGWLLALIVLGYFIFVHIIEGDVVGPRVMGKAIGVHPAVSIFALIAGAELFGIWGALFASPLAGLTQAILTEIWRDWREAHSDLFSKLAAITPAPMSESEEAEVMHRSEPTLSQQNHPDYRESHTTSVPDD
jgi:predicted PurR-regulated permease PerM